MIDISAFKKISQRIDTYKDAMIKMQIDLTAIPAMSPDNGGDGEYGKAKYLLSQLKDAEFSNITEIDASDNRVSSGVRPNIFVTIPGKNTDKIIWILTHIDVVPPGERGLWDEAPFNGYVKDGKIYGRGTEDNQQDLVASVFAAKSFYDEGIIPENTIGLAFVADEETASHYGLSYVLKHKDNPIHKKDIIVVPDSGNKDGTMIEIAEKSILWLRFRTIGTQCHASRPNLGNNAFQAASHLIVLLNNLHEIFNASDPFYQPETSTFQPTKKEPNIPNINTIPGDDVFYMDCRILPHYRLSDVIHEIRKIANNIEQRFQVSIEINAIQEFQSPSPTPFDAPVISALQEAIQHVYHVTAVPQGIGAGTIAAVFRENNYPAAVWSKVNHTAHQPNENCLIANMIGNAKVYAHIFMQKGM